METGGSKLGYDENGNVISSESKGVTINYDSWFDLPVSMTTGSSVTAFQYAGANERVLKINSHNGQTDKVLYIRGAEDYPLIEESAQGIKIYIYGPNGLLAIKQDGQFQYPLKDHLGSTRVLVSGTGAVVSHFDYLAFGGIMRSTSPAEVNYRFTGQEYDAETQLQNFRARLYDGDLGIFYGTDPDEEYYSPYIYCSDNPVQLTDPSGRSSLLAGLLSALANWGVGLANQAVNGGVKDFSFVFTNSFNMNSGSFGVFSTQRNLGGSVSKKTGFRSGKGSAKSPIVLNEIVITGSKPGFWDGFWSGTTDALTFVNQFNPISNGYEAYNGFRYGTDSFGNPTTALDNTLNLMGAVPFGSIEKGLSKVAVKGEQLLAKEAAKTGTSVLGHYPEYVKLAESLGARRFQIPTSVWNKMSAAEQWTANTKFLDRMILRGDNIRLATPLNQVKPGSFFQKELNYLFDKGYKVSSDGLWLVK